MDFLNEAEIYEPLEESGLIKIIPSEDKIFYSAIFKSKYISYRTGSREKVKWQSHVIMTDHGMAFISSIRMAFISSIGGINNGLFYYVPWYTIYFSDGWLRIGKGSTNWRFLLIKDKDIESQKQYALRKRELDKRIKLLIEKSKEELYNRLAPILKSYPYGKMPSHNPSEISIDSDMYPELKRRAFVERRKEVKQGVLKYPEEIKLVAKNINYTKERIIEEFKNAKLEQGMYRDVKKKDEMVMAFGNFFTQHSLSESTDLLIELFIVNPIFFNRWYKVVKELLISGEKEKDFFEMEKVFAENTEFKLSFENDEHIITHYKGSLSLPKPHIEFKGHVYITNYRLIIPGFGLAKNINVPSYLPILGSTATLIGGAIAKGLQQRIINARKQLISVLQQNPEGFPLIKTPYNLKISDLALEFTMNYDYIDKATSKEKIYKLVVKLVVERYKKESSKDFKQRKNQIFSKIRDFFSFIPETVCPKCGNVQDKKILTCEKCGKALKLWK